MNSLARILVVLLTLVALTDSAEAMLGLGETAPDFSLANYSGGSHSLSQYAGNVVVLFFVGWG